MIEQARIQALDQRAAPGGDYVLYWMQQSQRASWNPALELAVAEANARGLPVVVAFGLMDGYPEANLRHYAFMLQGLAEVEASLAARGIGFVIRRGAPPEVALRLGAEAALIVCDRGYLRHQRQWRAAVAGRARCPVIQVEGDVVVPVEVVSGRHEVAARTLRPKLLSVWQDYLHDLDEQKVETPVARLPLESDVDLSDLEGALAALDLDRSVPPVRRFTGGTGEARRRLAAFLDQKLAGYGGERMEPAGCQCSLLSPYLHFGQISPVEVSLAVQRSGRGTRSDRGKFLDELVVRRELSMNFVHFEPDYDRWRCVPGWARASLDAHRDDPREHRYGRAQLEACATHDPYWNAAMHEMVRTGYMHNTLRMYWAKKILEWSDAPEEAFATTLYLNNRYFLDGRDPNSYGNVAWAYGLHDRPWFERPVFGTVRYMNANGLRRKFDMEAYMAAVDELVRNEAG